MPVCAAFIESRSSSRSMFDPSHHEASLNQSSTQLSTHASTQPGWVRITHWINALAVVVMVTSGWQVYNASPIFRSFVFPSSITLGGWLGGALLWHFAAMWVLVVNFLVYVGLNQKDQAMVWLEKAFEERFSPWVLMRPAFDPLRSDPRFQDLLHRIGLSK